MLPEREGRFMITTIFTVGEIASKLDALRAELAMLDCLTPGYDPVTGYTDDIADLDIEISLCVAEIDYLESIEVAVVGTTKVAA